MRTRLLLPFIACVLSFPMLLSAAPAPASGDLRLRADAISALYDLGLTSDQLHALAKIASETAAKPPASVRLPPKLRNALVEWCDAMLKGGDDDKISQLQDKVDELEASAPIDDPQIQITDAAKKRTADLEKLLTAGQLAGFIAARSDDVASPSEVLIDALDDARVGSDEDYKDVRSDTVDEVVAMAHGNDADSDQIGEKAGAYLDRVRKMSDADFTAKRHDLEEEAKRIGAHVDAFGALHHWADHAFAEMLSNPELLGAIIAMEAHARAGAAPK